MKSIRWRLALAAAATICIALFLTGWVLQGLFHEHVTKQFREALEIRLDQVTAELETDEDGTPYLDPEHFKDPLWQQPYSGLYWQAERITSANASSETRVLRSRSLWDATLTLPSDTLADGRTHHHEIPGPNRQTLMALERSVHTDESGQWRLLVAADMASVEEAVREFSGLLALSLGILFALLLLAAVLQIHVGLLPLRRLRESLRKIRQGKAQQLSGSYPEEIEALVDDFNQVLSRNAEIVSRSRTLAGNLAHAIKTPLAVLQQAGELARNAPESEELARLMLEQVAIAERQVNWHLAHSRAAAAAGVPGHATPLAPVLASLIRAMHMIYNDRGIYIASEPSPAGAVFAGESEDLQEMLGNLLDNACKWARSRVAITVASKGAELGITIADDGLGLSPEAMDSALRRGVRCDENTPGSGLGLAIVTELASLYRGKLELSSSPHLGGLEARLTLPTVADGFREAGDD